MTTCSHTYIARLFWAGFVLTALACALIVMPLSTNAQEADFTGKSSLDDVYNANATPGFVPLSNTGGSSRIDTVLQSGNLSDFINRLFIGAIALGGILAVLRLAWAGFEYMGTDLWGKKEKAKEIIQDTLLGLFLLLAIVLILRQINPNLLNLDAARTIKANPIPAAQATDAQKALDATRGSD